MAEVMVFILAAGVIAVALLFAFINGFHDGCNVLATMVSSRSLPPRYALILGASSEFLGAIFLGRGVAKTVGLGILNIRFVTLWVVLAALLGAIIWNLITWYFGIPSSSSHALIGGLIGSGLAEAFFLGSHHLEVVNWISLGWIFVVLFISPPVGLLLGFLVTRLSFFLSRGASPKINRVFKILQVGSSFFIGLTHASNDAPKTMGVILMVLCILSLRKGVKVSFTVPGWVVYSSSFFLALGVLRVGWRIMRTVGTKIYRIRPIHGFGAQTGASIIILLSSLTGFPVSTTQIVNSSVMGAGASEKPKAVRWNVTRSILLTWIITIPLSALIAAGIYLLIRVLLII